MPNKQAVFVKHKCPPPPKKNPVIFLSVTLVFDVDLDTTICVSMRCAFIPNNYEPGN